MLIAAHALSRRLILVTNDVQKLRRVPGLSVQNWVAPYRVLDHYPHWIPATTLRTLVG